MYLDRLRENRTISMLTLVMFFLIVLGFLMLGKTAITKKKVVEWVTDEPRTLYCKLVNNATFTDRIYKEGKRTIYWIGTTSNTSEKVYYSIYKTDFGYYYLTIFQCTPYNIYYSCTIYARKLSGEYVSIETIELSKMAKLYKYYGNPEDIYVSCKYK